MACNDSSSTGNSINDQANVEHSPLEASNLLYALNPKAWPGVQKKGQLSKSGANCPKAVPTVEAEAVGRPFSRGKVGASKFRTPVRYG